MHNAEQERFVLRWKGSFAEKVQRPYVGTGHDWESANKRRRTIFIH